MGSINETAGWREVTVVDYSANENPDCTTAGCAWNIAEEAAAVNDTTVEDEFSWLLDHNSELAKNPDLVCPGQKVRVHYIPNKNHREAAGVDKEGKDVALQADKQGNLSKTQSKDLVAYRQPISGKKGSYVEVPVNKGNNDSIIVHDGKKEPLSLKPNGAYTTENDEVVRNLPGDEYSITTKTGETGIFKPNGDMSKATHSEPDKGAEKTSNKNSSNHDEISPGEKKNINLITKYPSE